MSLDRAAIVKVALELLDQQGIEGLSTRRLANALNIRGPSLYWHFKNKRELLDYMAETMLEAAVPPTPETFTPAYDRRTWLADGARGIRHAALAYRDGAHVLAGSKPTGMNKYLAYEKMVAALQRSGVGAGDAATIFQVLGRYAVGWVLYEQSQGDNKSPSSSEAGFEFGLRALIDGIEDRLAAGAPLAEPVAA